MIRAARDGKPFTTAEKNAYHVGYGAGKWRREHDEFMGSAYKTGYRGRLRLIFNEGLEDGYSSVPLETTANTRSPAGWRENDFAKWKGETVRITAIYHTGRAHISNMNMPLCGAICQTVPIEELKPNT
jgi:hypothetical protein